MAAVGYCAACRSSAGPRHLSTAKHRKATAPKAAGAWNRRERDYNRPRYADQYRVSAEEERAAMQRLEAMDGYAPILAGPGPEWIEPVENDNPPEPRTASAPAMAPAYVASDANLGPCPRCGRIDWQTVKGRTWHVENNPDCVKYRKPGEHQYATA